MITAYLSEPVELSVPVTPAPKLIEYPFGYLSIITPEPPELPFLLYALDAPPPPPPPVLTVACAGCEPD